MFDFSSFLELFLLFLLANVSNAVLVIKPFQGKRPKKTEVN